MTGPMPDKGYESMEVTVARLEGKVDYLAEVLRRVETQTTKTNGIVRMHASRLDKAEGRQSGVSAATGLVMGAAVLIISVVAVLANVLTG